MKLQVGLAQNNRDDFRDLLVDVGVVFSQHIKTQLDRAGVHVESYRGTKGQITCMSFDSLKNFVAIEDYSSRPEALRFRFTLWIVRWFGVIGIFTMSSVLSGG